MQDVAERIGKPSRRFMIVWTCAALHAAIPVTSAGPYLSNVPVKCNFQAGGLELLAMETRHRGKCTKNAASRWA